MLTCSSETAPNRPPLVLLNYILMFILEQTKTWGGGGGGVLNGDIEHTMQTHAHIVIYTHFHTNTDTLTHIHTRTPPTHTHTCTQTHTCTHTHNHSCSQTTHRYMALSYGKHTRPVTWGFKNQSCFLFFFTVFVEYEAKICIFCLCGYKKTSRYFALTADLVFWHPSQISKLLHGHQLIDTNHTLNKNFLVLHKTS